MKLKNVFTLLTCMSLLLFSFWIASCSHAYQPEKIDLAFVSPPSADAVKNPLKGDQQAVLAGQKLYLKECTPCHGKKGEGDGISSVSLSRVPANHTAAKMKTLSDGALYWKISNGFSPMPPYNRTLSETQRWQLVNFLRTLPTASK